MIISVSGASRDWLRWNSSWGNSPNETAIAKSARTKLFEATPRKVGFGTQTRVDLTEDEAWSLFSILDSIAGVGETLTTEERGEDVSSYRAIRKDAEKIYKLIGANA